MRRQKTAEPLRVKVLDVGQGDAIVVLLPGGRRALVVDAFDEVAVLRVLEEEAVGEVVLFLSHSDEDHVKGVEYLLDNFQGSLVAAFFNADRLEKTLKSGYVRRLRALAAASRHNAPTGLKAWPAPFDTNLNGHDRFRSLVDDPVAIEVLHPTYDERISLLGTSANEASGVVRITCKCDDGVERSVLLAGDIQLTGISCMMHNMSGTPQALSADVLKFPHHGAWPARYEGWAQFSGRYKRTMTEFLDTVDPSVVVLSVGLHNDHGHVRKEAFRASAALRRNGKNLDRVLCTQFTRTCLGSDETRMSPACAGDIEVRIGPGVPQGIEVIPDQGCHRGTIETVRDAGKVGCAALLG